ncbi:MAG TPA: PEP-CTERM sorting domain-containing protein [Deltaproteobacteria bacterium]|jgi:hypothetical protein|nr:PEP-CTERM sorting domain-containing protein [Deltaproteobacteria bacterium]HOI07961.1 PEP-CTERM sorting domain-containing protein [Deltaproteobacteria bacterium]
MVYLYRIFSLSAVSKTALAAISLLIAVPCCLQATLWTYTATGTMEHGDALYAVSGTMIIDDTFRTWNGGYEAPPAEEAGPMGGVFSYYIPSYSLSLNEGPASESSLFSGSRGTFYLSRLVNSSSYGDFEWLLDDGSGAWDQWAAPHSGYSFHHADGSPYDLSEYGTLAPGIRLYGSTGMHVPGNGWEDCITDISLLRTDAAPAPVPEPGTLLLLGLGLAGVATMGRKLGKGRRA